MGGRLWTALFIVTIVALSYFGCTVPETWPTVWDSLLAGVTIGTLSVLMAVAWRLSYGVFSEPSRDGHWETGRNIAIKIAICAVAPAFIIQPAIFVLVLFQDVGKLFPFSISDTWLGIIVIGVLLYLPFSHFIVQEMPLQKWKRRRRTVNNLGVSGKGTYAATVIVPLLLWILPVICAISVMAQGMTFTPELSTAGTQSTLGARFYSYHMETPSGEEVKGSVYLLYSIVSLYILVTIGVWKLTRQYSGKVSRWILWQASKKAKNVEHANTPNNRASISKYVRQFFGILGLFPYMTASAIHIAALYFLVRPTFVQLISGEENFQSLRNTFTVNKTSAALGEVMHLTARNAFFAAIIGTIVALALAVLAGRYDRWRSEGPAYSKIRIVFYTLVMIPVVLYASLLISLLVRSTGVLVLLLTVVSVIFGIFALQDSLFTTIYSYERVRDRLGFQRRPFWLPSFSLSSDLSFKLTQRFYGRIVGAIVLFAVFAGLIAWNDITVQLFVVEDLLPNKFMSITRNGLEEDQRAVLGLLQGILVLPFGAFIYFIRSAFSPD